MAGLTRRPDVTASACQSMRALPCCGGSGGVNVVVPAIPYDFVMIQLVEVSGLSARWRYATRPKESQETPLVYRLRLPWQSSLWHEGMAASTLYTAKELPFGVIPPDFR